MKNKKDEHKKYEQMTALVNLTINKNYEMLIKKLKREINHYIDFIYKNSAYDNGRVIIKINDVNIYKQLNKIYIDDIIKTGIKVSDKKQNFEPVANMLISNTQLYLEKLINKKDESELNEHERNVKKQIDDLVERDNKIINEELNKEEQEELMFSSISYFLFLICFIEEKKDFYMSGNLLFEFNFDKFLRNYLIRFEKCLYLVKTENIGVINLINETTLLDLVLKEHKFNYLVKLQKLN